MAKSKIIGEIDLRKMEEQLERHLDRVFSNQNNNKGCEELKVTIKEEWELDATKLKVNNLIDEGAYGSVYKGVYDGQQVAGIYYAMLVYTCVHKFYN